VRERSEQEGVHLLLGRRGGAQQTQGVARDQCVHRRDRAKGRWPRFLLSVGLVLDMTRGDGVVRAVLDRGRCARHQCARRPAWAVRTARMGHKVTVTRRSGAAPVGARFLNKVSGKRTRQGRSGRLRGRMPKVCPPGARRIVGHPSMVARGQTKCDIDGVLKKAQGVTRDVSGKRARARKVSYASRLAD
jgi:hypothetical protein